jgi:hypothetical protein
VGFFVAQTLVFVLVGQSNMVGMGQPVPTQIPNPQIVTAAGTPASDPLFSEPLAGVGPGMSFARYLVARTPYRVMLIPCAASGTTIAQWQRGQPLFENCVTLTRGALKHAWFGGVLFFQGESDATDQGVSAWPRLFKTFARDFRTTVGNAPLVYAQIARPPETPEWQAFQEPWLLMRAAQARIRVPDSAVVRTSDLPYGVDAASQNHFSPEAYTKIGERFAQALLGLTRLDRPGS